MGKTGCQKPVATTWHPFFKARLMNGTGSSAQITWQGRHHARRPGGGLKRKQFVEKLPEKKQATNRRLRQIEKVKEYVCIPPPPCLGFFFNNTHAVLAKIVSTFAGQFW